MTEIKFQAEPTTKPVWVKRAQTNRIEEFKLNSINQSTAIHLLFGYLTRGWLTEVEMETLDRLASSHTMVFLAHDQKYIHPENISLLPDEVGESALNRNDSAVLSHFLDSGSTQNLYRHKIITAVINPGEPNPLVIGMFGPDHEISSAERENNFLQIVSNLRTAYLPAKEMADSLSERMNSKHAVILIGRNSGRLIAMNKQACSNIKRDSRLLIGQEYSQTKPLVEKIIEGNKFKIENIGDDNLCLSVITVMAESEVISHSDLLIKYLTGRINQYARQLDQQIRFGTKSDNCEISSPRISTANRLIAYTSVLKFLTCTQNKVNKKINLLYETDRAIKTVTGGINGNYPLTLNSSTPHLTRQQPKELFQQMVTAILLSQIQVSGGTTSQIKITQSKIETKFQITTKSLDNKMIEFDEVIFSIAKQISQKLGIKIVCKTSDNGSINSSITIPASGKIAGNS